MSHPVSHNQAELSQAGGLFLLRLVRLLPAASSPARGEGAPVSFNSLSWPSLPEQHWETGASSAFACKL